MNADELVALWALDKYKSQHHYRTDMQYYHKYNHLILCPTVTATPAIFEWLCGCYSEYTRDDGFSTAFTISCACGVSEHYWCYTNDWDLPEILKELAEYEDTQTCPYWNE
jgi:hypothetical protein